MNKLDRICDPWGRTVEEIDSRYFKDLLRPIIANEHSHHLPPDGNRLNSVLALEIAQVSVDLLRGSHPVDRP